ncbi:hypothetical protein ACQKGC_15890 [Allorhizobium pseudoryzae]|uniref:hypothetical protein n=1 Tax=Allorhizobium pseudoryzae TaxID=379684 RepID=UPI003D005B37
MKVSLKSQIAAIDAITSGRFSIVASNQAARSLLIDQLQAVALTLRLIQKHEAEIRAVLEAKKDSRP